MNNLIEKGKQDNRTQLLCSILKNEYIKNVIIGFMRKMHLVNEDNNPNISVKKFQLIIPNDYQIPLLSHTNSHLSLSLSFKYNQLFNVDWMAKNGYIGLIKYKLERNDHLVFSSDSAKLICENIGCDNGSDDKLETFKYIYTKNRYLFYDGEMMAHFLAAGGSIKCLEYIMQNHKYPIAAQVIHESSLTTRLEMAFEHGRVEMLKYLYSKGETQIKYIIYSGNKLKFKLPLSNILELYNWVKNGVAKSEFWRNELLNKLVNEYISKIVDFNVNQEEENWDGIFHHQEIHEMVYDMVVPLEVLNGMQDEKLKLAIYILHNGLVNNHEAMLYYVFVVKKCSHLEAMKLLFAKSIYRALIPQNLLSVDQIATYRMIDTNTPPATYVYLKSLLSSLDANLDTKVPFTKINYFERDTLETYLRECTPQELTVIIQKILFKPHAIHRHHYNRIAKIMMDNYKDQIESTPPGNFTSNYFVHVAVQSNLYLPLVEFVTSKSLAKTPYNFIPHIFMNDPSGRFKSISKIQLPETQYPGTDSRGLINEHLTFFAKGGHIEEMEKIFRYTYPDESKIWFHILYQIIRSAINGSQIQVLDYLSQKYPMELEYELQNNMRVYMSDIGSSGALNLLKSNYFNVALYKNEYIHLILEGAIPSGHIPIVKYIYDLNPDKFELEQDWFIDMCISNNVNALIEYVHSIGKCDLKKQLRRDNVATVPSMNKYIKSIIDK